MLAHEPSKLVHLRPKFDPCITSDPLIVFLYELMQNHLTMGQMEKAMESVRPLLGGDKPRTKMTNKHLANYAREIADQLAPNQPSSKN